LLTKVTFTLGPDFYNSTKTKGFISMKNLLLNSLAVCLASHITASTSIEWKQGAAGGIRTESGAIAPVPVNSVWALYFSTDAIIDPINPSGSLLTSGGNDQLVLATNNSAPGNLVAASDLPGGNSVQNFGAGLGQSVGYYYSRVFNFVDSSIDATSSATWSAVTIPDGAYYFQSAIVGPSPETFAIVPAPAPLVVFYNNDGVNNGSGLSPQMTTQFFAIPEPSVLGLMFIGLAFVARFVRRK
jgi:hypothetical protein